MLRYEDAHSEMVYLAPQPRDTVKHLSLAPTGLGACSLHEYRRDINIKEETTATPLGDAMMAVLMLKPAPPHRAWINGREKPVGQATRGQVRFYDLRNTFVHELVFGFHTIHLMMPNQAFAHKDNSTPAWNRAFNEFNNDEVLFHLLVSMMPSLTHPDGRDQLFCDLMFQAMSQHIARRYADFIVGDHSFLGKLSPRQEARAKELLIERISGNVALDDIAIACGLSSTHFTRLFKRTTGLSPYRWLTLQRIEKAKMALLLSNDSLVEIALASGFANQSHFTRVFSSIVLASPGQWRRQMKA